MTDLEEEQPTQSRGRRDWNEKGKDETSLRGDDLTGDTPLVPSPETQAEAYEGQGDGNPGGGLMRSDVKANKD